MTSQREFSNAINEIEKNADAIKLFYNKSLALKVIMSGWSVI